MTNLEERTISELLSELINNDEVYTEGRYIELWEITDKIDFEEMREAMQANLRGDSCAVYTLYIKALEEYLA
jgi:hypothetical protein